MGQHSARTMSALDFFGWLARFKALSSSLRSVTKVTVFIKIFIDAGCPDAAEMLRGLHLPHFAHWRWGTRRAGCEGMRPILSLLAKHYELEAFKRSLDTTLTAKVEEALASEVWHKQYALVARICQWVGGIMDWCVGCPCHVAGDVGPKECQRRGRRWHQAFELACRALRAGLQAANEW